MHQPGVETRPIKLIAGASPFCETFFTDVKVPKENLVGPLNGGWTIAKRLLQHERQGIGSAAGWRAAGVPGLAGRLAKTYVGVDEDGRIADADLRTRITDHLMERAGPRADHASAPRRRPRGNRGPSATTSIMKNAGTTIGQETRRADAGDHGPPGPRLGAARTSRADELGAVRGWLSGKADTIAGGSHEVQNNIISKRILGLPDTTHST